VWSVINSLQNDISEDIRTPWPSTDGRTMPMPEVESDGAWIHLWFGERQAPVLSIPAIGLQTSLTPTGVALSRLDARAG
jgi:hypothetical protein